MPFSIRPHRRFPVPADTFLKLPLASPTHFERNVLGQEVRFAIGFFPLHRCRVKDRTVTVSILYSFVSTV